VSDHRKLRVWKAANALATEVVELAPKMSRRDHRELREQTVRAAISIPANIVEGTAYTSARDFARFLQYASGSAAELEQHLGMARKLCCIRESDLDRLSPQLTSVQKMLAALRRRVLPPDDK
jgi:four helix bundle protein